MTEPEDLEEDIFADLYDGDTGNSKDDLPHSQTQLPVRQTSPVINPIQPEIKEEKPAPDDKDDKDSVKLPFRPGSSTTHALPPEIERDDDRAMNWTNGQHNGLDDNSTEQDPPLIGIKEDG
ncbi:MAG: hypothetical protein M1816_006489 [Peltula sp. TS41687]|nr:MAG: hypothetical protein M1816_006489 [Peltula sp. TS41687]